MASKLQKTMNATIVTGKYFNAKQEEKKTYLNVGTLFVYEGGGMSLKLDVIPPTDKTITFYDHKKKEA
jgi:hypothetical protein